jgi:hypothetical protein
MKKGMLILGILFLSGVLFAHSEDPAVESIFAKAFCSAPDAGTSLFDQLSAAAHGYNSSYDSQFTALNASLVSARGAMVICTDTPQPSTIRPCVSSHYALYLGYLNQVQALYFRAAFDAIRAGGPTWATVMTEFLGFQSDFRSCLIGP